MVYINKIKYFLRKYIETNYSIKGLYYKIYFIILFGSLLFYKHINYLFLSIIARRVILPQNKPNMNIKPTIDKNINIK